MCLTCDVYRESQVAMGGQPFDINGAGEPGYMQPSGDVFARHLTDGCEPVLDEGEWVTACEIVEPEANPVALDGLPILCEWRDGSQSVLSIPFRVAMPIEAQRSSDRHGCDRCEADAEWISLPLAHVGPSAEGWNTEFYCPACMLAFWNAEDRREAS